MLKKSFVFLFKSIIILLMMVYVFSSAFNVQGIIRNSISDLYDYSVPATQTKINNLVDLFCTSGQTEFQGIDLKTECLQYDEEEIDIKEVLFTFMGKVSQSSLIKGTLKEYNDIIIKVPSNRIWLFIASFTLMALSFFLIDDTRKSINFASSVFLKLGILIFLPYLIVVGYDYFQGLDTTTLVEGIFNPSLGLPSEGVISGVMILVINTYDTFVINLGIIFLTTGILGKVAMFIYNKKFPKH
tara:strand:+ start:2682 stop:3407 length:726 start_codon:yes stop_codon:yes gene_type:complete